MCASPGRDRDVDRQMLSLKANAEFAHCTEFRNYKSHSEKVMKRQNARGEAGREKRKTNEDK